MPYFFRIGSEQPIPTFKFNFGAICKNAKFELYLNLKPECQVSLHLSENGFSVSTKITPNIDFNGLPSLMVFGEKYVSVKIVSPLAIKSLEICELPNEPDVPLDQFVLQIAPNGDVQECKKAEIVLLNSNMIHGTEVLIDRSKIVDSINATTESENNSTLASIVTTPKSVESAEFAWWWIVVGGILFFGIIVGIIVFIFCIRRRRQQKKKLPPVESIVEDEEIGRITIETKTALSPEKLSKEMKPKIVGKEKKEKPTKKKAAAKGNKKPPKSIEKPKSELPSQSAEPSEQQQSPKSLKPASRKNREPPLSILPKPLRNLQFQKPTKKKAAAKGNKKTPKSIEKPKSELSSQSAEPSKQQQPPKSLKPASRKNREPPPPTNLPKPLRNLQFRSMYGR
uniref:Uncharacterized protein n=1 Tax=Panagrolaimus sp. PS1159 TaxID=55785 RepID=A0AC35GKP6_9BILA